LASSNWFRDDDPNDGAPAILGLNDLAAVAADPTWGPYYAIGARSTRPYSSVAEPGRTWLDEWNAVFDSTIAGTVVFHGGFQGGQFFLQEEGAPVLGDYTAHPTHVDDVRAFASPVSAIEIFAPGN
jgi:hypothetical protein